MRIRVLVFLMLYCHIFWKPQHWPWLLGMANVNTLPTRSRSRQSSTRLHRSSTRSTSQMTQMRLVKYRASWFIFGLNRTEGTVGRAREYFEWLPIGTFILQEYHLVEQSYWFITHNIMIFSHNTWFGRSSFSCSCIKHRWHHILGLSVRPRGFQPSVSEHGRNCVRFDTFRPVFDVLLILLILSQFWLANVSNLWFPGIILRSNGSFVPRCWFPWYFHNFTKWN